MSVAAVMLVKDEADVIEPIVRHLCMQVDEVLVADNLSTDGTRGILEALAADLPVVVTTDQERGYFQSSKTSALAQRARERGHEWVVPCDADEVWYSPFGRIGDVLEGLGTMWTFASAQLYYHVSTGADDHADADPTSRMSWRFRESQGLPKVACRVSEDLWIGMGNHEATRSAAHVHSSGSPPRIDGHLVIRHFPWRSRQQLLSKLRNGSAAYEHGKEGIPAQYGEHWRQWHDKPDIAIFEWFDAWAFCPDPQQPWTQPDGNRASLIYDPAPVSRPELEGAWDGAR